MSACPAVGTFLRRVARCYALQVTHTEPLPGTDGVFVGCARWGLDRNTGRHINDGHVTKGYSYRGHWHRVGRDAWRLDTGCQWDAPIYYREISTAQRPQLELFV